MASIRSQQTAEKTYEMQTLYGLKAVDNPMLIIGFNPYMGTPLEVLHTILLFILSPYLSSDDRKVLLSFSKVFRIAYFSPHLYHEWKSICENFVISVKQTMPELLNKPKVHLILHLVDCMVNLGPCSAFSAERDESIYQPGALRKRLSKSPHVLQHVVLNTIGLSCATIEDLHCHDSSTTIELFHCMEDSLVAVFKGLIAADGGLVHAGDFVELLCSETKYALFLTSCQLETGESFCVLQGCDEFVVNSEPVLNEYECPLLAITKRIFSADCSQIKQAVSIVHECSDSCCYQFCIIVAVQLLLVTLAIGALRVETASPISEVTETVSKVFENRERQTRQTNCVIVTALNNGDTSKLSQQCKDAVTGWPGRIRLALTDAILIILNMRTCLKVYEMSEKTSETSEKKRSEKETRGRRKKETSGRSEKETSGRNEKEMSGRSEQKTSERSEKELSGRSEKEMSEGSEKEMSRSEKKDQEKLLYQDSLVPRPRFPTAAGGLHHRYVESGSGK
eukprot:Em0001g1939a